MNDESRQAFEDEKRRIASQKKVAQATSTNQLSTVRLFVSTGRSSVSTNRSNTPNVSAASTSTGANADKSSFVYLRGKIPIDASTLPNADLPIDPNMPNLEDAYDTLPNDRIFNGAYDDDEDVGAVADFNNMDNTIAVKEPKTISQALKDESWVKAMQEELLQFKLQQVWILVDLPFGKKAIGTKIEAIRLFLAFASYKGFLVYQMDVKSAFLYGTIEEEVYVHQPLGFVDPAHPNKVYKVVKALYGYIKLLELVYVDDIIFGSTKKSMCTEFEEVKQQPDRILISQDKYVADILKKFDFCSIKIATTPIESNKPLVKDEDGVEVDVHECRSMIGSLMYLTTSRLDIMFAVCACARDSPFELETFSDSDYAGASLDRKSTTGGCQFLGRRLISWQCKKQTIMANSTTEAEYVAAAHCCGQVLWIQNQMMDYGFNFMNTKIHIDNESTICVVKNLVYHSRTKHIEIRHHFIRDCYEKRLIDVLKIHTDSNVADLLTKGFDVTRISMDLRMDRSSPGKYNSSMVNSGSLQVNSGSLLVNSVDLSNGNSSYHDRRPSLEESLTKFMAESAKRHEENSNIIKEIRASTDAAIRNQRASIKTLEIQIKKMIKVLQERWCGSLPTSIETNPRDQVKSISTADFSGICRIGCEAQDVKILDAYDHTLPQKEEDLAHQVFGAVAGDCFTNFESEFPTIVLDDTSREALSWEPTVSPLNDNEIDFRISFDESNDEDYTVIYDKNSFSYKIISVDNLKTDSENDKVNMRSFPSPEPEVSYSNDLDFFKDFENEFPAIVYNDALTSKSYFLTEHIVSPQHIDEFNNEMSLSECD
ncbi:putative ribonuclease H-like domain-containing protein [Tanacetum coccineum]